MTRNRRRVSRCLSLAAAALLATGAFAGRASAQEATLKVGDPAPKLAVGKWVQGDPVKELEKGKLYVVEFWATWCGPCRQTIPHLNELSQKHKDVTFIGQDVFEQEEDKVAPFVKEMGEKMTYRVALDDKSTDAEGAMSTTWMKAAGQNGIPTAFIIDKEAKVAWIGHPMAMEKPLEQIVAGTYDAKAEAEKAEKAKAMQAPLQKALQSGDFEGAVKAADDLAKADPSMAQQLAMLKFQIHTKSPKKNYPAANKIAAELADTLKEPQQLNELAWMMVGDASYENPDLDVALKAAQAAVAGLKEKDAASLDTLAAVYAKKGDNAKALETQKKAVAAAPADQKAQLEETLKKYEGAEKK